METVYIETTIVSYLVARPSRDLVLAAHQQLTRDWWQNERLNYQCVTSEEVIREAAQGEAVMSRARLEAMDGIPVIPITAEVETRASTFLNTGAVPATMRPDATHLAAAVQAGADYLLTWNCRHLANAHVLRRLRKEAERRGWSLPEVCTPLELMGDSAP
jgi:hypothetical protein